MTQAAVVAAMAEAHRFISASRDGLRELKGIVSDSDGVTASWITGTKISGRLRRASMDLTRALAEMRRR